MEKYIAEVMEGKFEYVTVIVDNIPRKVLKRVWDANYKLEVSTATQKQLKHEIKVTMDDITYSGCDAIKLMNYSSFENVLKTKYEMNPLSYEERNKLPAMLGTIAWCRIFMKETPTYKRYVDTVIESIKRLHMTVLAMHGNSNDVTDLCKGIHLDIYLPISIACSPSWRAVNPTDRLYLTERNGVFDNSASESYISGDKYVIYLIKELIKYKYPDFMRIENYGQECADLVGILYPQSNNKIGAASITLHDIFSKGFEALHD